MLDNLEPANKPQPPKDFRPAVEFDGTQGTATTPGYKEAPANFDEFLVDAGLNPDEIDIIPPVRTSRWQQREGGEWLTSYRFTFHQRTGDKLDLPTLFQQAKRTKKPKEKEVTKGKALVIAPADWQLGKTGSRGGTPETIERLMRSFDRIEEKLKKTKYEVIVIVDMGDIIEGITSKANFNQLESNDLSVPQQLDAAASLMWELLKRCSKYAPVKLGSVASNHCQVRVGGQQVGKPGLDDYGITILQQLRRLSHEIGLDVSYFIPQPQDEGFALDVFDDDFHILGAIHGHQVSRPSNIPEFWRKQSFGKQFLEHASVLVTGHFHHTCVLEMGSSHNGGSRWWVQAATSDAGSDWFRRISGEDSGTGVTAFELDRDTPFTGTVFRL